MRTRKSLSYSKKERSTVRAEKNLMDLLKIAKWAALQPHGMHEGCDAYHLDCMNDKAKELVERIEMEAI